MNEKKPILIILISKSERGKNADISSGLVNKKTRGGEDRKRRISWDSERNGMTPDGSRAGGPRRLWARKGDKIRVIQKAEKEGTKDTLTYLFREDFKGGKMTPRSKIDCGDSMMRIPKDNKLSKKDSSNPITALAERQGGGLLGPSARAADEHCLRQKGRNFWEKVKETPKGVDQGRGRRNAHRGGNKVCVTISYAGCCIEINQSTTAEG